MRHLLAAATGLLGVLLLAPAGPALAASASAQVGFGTLFFDGGTIRTVVTPVAQPGSGTDPFFEVTNGVSGQLGITGVAPGLPDYHGGHWAVSTVNFNPGMAPFLLTSAAAVQAAASAGEVTVTSTPAADFLCPVQP
jgi:hypothetical protein